ncbi:MAG: YkvA family protein [Cyanobacteria bacterium P01_E01_bin.6]
MKLFGWYRALMRNPQSRWLVIIGSLVYLVSPIDLSPDIIPFVGQIDDVILATLLFSELFQWLLGAGHLASNESAGAQQENDATVKTTVDVEAVSIDE